MNRREFLKSLAGLGTSILVPIDLSAASTREINTAWKVVNQAPAIFTVASWGTLSIGDYEEPGSRAEMYGIEAEWTNREELAELIRAEWQLESIAETVCADAVADHNHWEKLDGQIAFDSWEDWLAVAHEDDVAILESKITSWLEEKPDLGAEYEWLPPMNTFTPESRAYTFFKGQDDELLDSLGVVFVEGDHPGSTYFGAEFHGDIEETNSIAKAKSIPVRFVAEAGA
jgi:hypothetical protein